MTITSAADVLMGIFGLKRAEDHMCVIKDQGFEVRCPECGGIQRCGCDACRSRNQGEVVNVFNGFGIECGHCGYALSAGEWMVIEMNQYEAWNEARTTKGR